MSNAAAIAAVLAVGILTYSARAVPILFLADRTLPQPIERALRYVGPAVLSALVITLTADGEGMAGVDLEEWLALAAAAIATALTRNVIAALVAGMGTLWVVTWIL